MKDGIVLRQVQRLLRALQRDHDEESLHSGVGSNTDSGGGVSEEGGDALHQSTHHNNLHVGV